MTLWDQKVKPAYESLQLSTLEAQRFALDCANHAVEVDGAKLTELLGPKC